MLSKEKFIKAIKELEKFEKDIHAVHEAFKKLDPDFGGFYFSRANTLIGEILKDVMNDEYDNIDYFIYELDYGKKWHKGTITARNGKDIKMQTPEDLYNYLVKCNKDKK